MTTNEIDDAIKRLVIEHRCSFRERLLMREVYLKAIRDTQELIIKNLRDGILDGSLKDESIEMLQGARCVVERIRLGMYTYIVKTDEEEINNEQ